MEGSGFDLNDSVVLKNQNIFLVSAMDGSMPGPGRHPYGLYFNDCRLMSAWQLKVMGQPLRALVCSASEGYRAVHELTNHPLTGVHGRALEGETLQAVIERELVQPHALEERITLKSFARTPLELEVSLDTCAGFEPMLWIRGMAQDFEPARPRMSRVRDGVRREVTGRDGVRRSLTTVARPRPASSGKETLRWTLKLGPRKAATIALRHVPEEGGARRSIRPPARSRRSRGDHRPHPTDVRTKVSSDSPLFERIIERSLADLRMLRSRLGRQNYFAGGIPWYATVFGRDSLITAIEMLAYQPGIAEGTLRMIARRLGKEVSDWRDEEPGKALHEVRDGEISNLGMTPFARYYGSVDSTPLFLCLLAQHADWSGDLELFTELSSEVDAALGWLQGFADLDGDGLIEYERRSSEGLRNQGWKDSDDGVPDANGDPLRAPIALIEVQGYAIRAELHLAALYERAGESDRAAQLRASAAERRGLIDRFWLEHRGRYAMALDAGKHASPVLASNPGHLLWTHAVPPARARAIRDALMDDQLFCGWGLRTLGAGERPYNPLGYHTGSVWPHDSALIANGLRGYGFDGDFMRIFEGLLEAASHFPDYRLPELFAGFARDQYEVPVPYPVACHPQAWAAGALPYLLSTALGLVPEGLDGRLRVVRPMLPAWVGHLQLQGMSVAGSRVDLVLERRGEDAVVADIDVKGPLEVIVEQG